MQPEATEDQEGRKAGSQITLHVADQRDGLWQRQQLLQHLRQLWQGNGGR